MRKKFIQLLIEENKKKERKVYQPNEIIFYEDQPCEYVSIILKGAIQMFSIYRDKEVKFNYMKKNYIFGHNLIFNENNKYKAHVVAHIKCELLHLTKEEFLKSLQNPNILEAYLKYLSAVTLEDKEQIKVLKILNVYDQIQYLLDRHKGTYRFKSVTQFADLLGISREHLSRVLNELEEKGEIIKSLNYIKRR